MNSFGMGAAEVVERFNALFGGCSHRQAEPVVLSTGETVACVCVECLAALSADYVDQQLATALRYAFCRHEERIEIIDLGQAEPSYLCQSCGLDL